MKLADLINAFDFDGYKIELWTLGFNGKHSYAGTFTSASSIVAWFDSWQRVVEIRPESANSIQIVIE